MAIDDSDYVAELENELDWAEERLAMAGKKIVALEKQLRGVQNRLDRYESAIADTSLWAKHGGEEPERPKMRGGAWDTAYSYAVGEVHAVEAFLQRIAAIKEAEGEDRQ